MLGSGIVIKDVIQKRAYNILLGYKPGENPVCKDGTNRLCMPLKHLHIGVIWSLLSMLVKNSIKINYADGRNRNLGMLIDNYSLLPYPLLTNSEKRQYNSFIGFCNNSKRKCNGVYAPANSQIGSESDISISFISGIIQWHMIKYQSYDISRNPDIYIIDSNVAECFITNWLISLMNKEKQKDKLHKKQLEDLLTDWLHFFAFWESYFQLLQSKESINDIMVELQNKVTFCDVAGLPINEREIERQIIIWEDNYINFRNETSNFYSFLMEINDFINMFKNRPEKINQGSICNLKEYIRKYSHKYYSFLSC